jgi:nucleotide-binding universal stress UspA family protein
MADSYRTVLVGTDGSDTSFRAVDRAAELAAATGARLVIVSAYQPADEASLAREQDILGAESYQLIGSAPAEDNLSRARDRAHRAGHTQVETLAVQGDPVDVLRKVAEQSQAELIVVGNRGLNRLGGRLLGSVPSDVARRASVDVLIVHTTG